MKYYKAILSHGLSFKFNLENSEDANKLVRESVYSQNKGECKSDKVSVISIRNITLKEYKNCNWPERSYLLC